MLFNEENIDAFVSGKMTGAERILFETDMAKDPLLAREVKMQEDIQSGLQAHRRAELKQRLNNIDMTTASINLGSKVAASVLISAMVGVGLYLAINITEQTTPAVASAQITTKAATPAAEAVKPAAAPQAQVDPAQAPAQASQRNRNQQGTAAAQNNVVVDVPNVEGPSNSDIATSGNETPASGLGNTGNVSTVKSVATEFKPAHKAGEYSYQYYNNKLFLYGMNNSNSGVNILEFNKNGKKQLFIYTNNKYYQIKNDQFEIAPLKDIKDQGLIDQLNAYVK